MTEEMLPVGDLLTGVGFLSSAADHPDAYPVSGWAQWCSSQHHML